MAQGKADPQFSTKPELAWQLSEEARAAGIPFRVVVADCVYGEHPKLERRRFAARLRYVLALRPNRGTWPVVDDEANPPAGTPAEAVQRLPKAQWQRTVRRDSHGKDLVRSVAELELGTAYGPTRGVRLVAATDDPVALKADATWFLATNLTCAEASRLYSLRDWIEHFSKPAKHELGWADCQVRSERAIVRPWHLVLLAFTARLVTGTPAGADTGTPAVAPVRSPPAAGAPPEERATTSLSRPHRPGTRGESARPRLVWQATLRRVRGWVCPWARLHLYWGQWSTAPPPPELAALLAHVAHSRPLESPT